MLEHAAPCPRAESVAPASYVLYPSTSLRLLAALALLLFTTGLFLGGALPLAVGLFPAPWDKLGHVGTFAVISVAFGLVSATRGWRLFLYCLLGALAVGLMDELHQLWLPGRHAGWDDLLADAAGGLLGAGLLNSSYQFGQWYLQRLSQAQPAPHAPQALKGWPLWLRRWVHAKKTSPSVAPAGAPQRAAY